MKQNDPITPSHTPAPSGVVIIIVNLVLLISSGVGMLL